MKRSIFLVCLGMLLLALVCASAEELDLESHRFHCPGIDRRKWAGDLEGARISR